MGTLNRAIGKYLKIWNTREIPGSVKKAAEKYPDLRFDEARGPAHGGGKKHKRRYGYR